MKNQENMKTNKDLLDKLLEKKFGEDYTKTVSEDTIDKSIKLSFLLQKEEMKKCKHIFVPDGYDFSSNNPQLYLCVKCGLRNYYPNGEVSEEELPMEKEMFDIFNEIKDAIFIDQFDNPQYLMILYDQLKHIFPGLTDEAFIDYIYGTLNHYQVKGNSRTK